MDAMTGAVADVPVTLTVCVVGDGIVTGPFAFIVAWTDGAGVAGDVETTHEAGPVAIV